jgi:hypothetical protein
MSFYLKTAALSVAIALLSNVPPFFKGTSSSPIWYCVILIYALLTIFSWKWIAKAQTGSAIQFTTAVYGTTALKMLLTLIIITSYLAAKYPFPKQFAFGVFALFIAFTGLFVSATIHRIK